MKKRKPKQLPMYRDPEHQKRDSVFTLRCEPATLEKVKAKARDAGLSMNAWVRFAVVHALTFDIVGMKR